MWQELAPKLKTALIAYATATETCSCRADYEATTEVTFEKMLGDDGVYKVTMEALENHPVVRYRRLSKAALTATDLRPFVKAWTMGDLELTLTTDTKMTTESILQQYVFLGRVLKIGGPSHLLRETMATFCLPPEQFKRLNLQEDAGTVRDLYNGMVARAGKDMPFDELVTEFRNILEVWPPGALPDVPADQIKISVSKPFLRISSIDGVHSLYA